MADTPIFTGDALEQYLQGKPLNDMIAALRQPRNMALEMQQQRAPWIEPSSEDELLRELTKGERKQLLKLRQSDGWPVLQRLLKRALQMHHNTAISVSQQRPLENRDTIAGEWHTVATYKRLIQELLMQVDAEVKQLEPEKAKR